MSITQPLPADGDPPEEAAAGEGAAAPREQPARAEGPRTEHPLPESLPSGGTAS